MGIAAASDLWYTGSDSRVELSPALLLVDGRWPSCCRMRPITFRKEVMRPGVMAVAEFGEVTCVLASMVWQDGALAGQVWSNKREER